MLEADHPWWQPTVAKIEHGKRAIPSDEMATLSRILGVDPGWAVSA
jgi:hypothetical protein